jgi:hypothetical protein
MVKLHNTLLDTINEVDNDFIDEDDNESSFVIRGKWILDGSDNLLAAAEMARNYADFLEGLYEDGYELVGTIDNDYGFAKLTNV